MICPKCGNNQVSTEVCEHCGLIFAKYAPSEQSPITLGPKEKPKKAPKKAPKQEEPSRLIECAACGRDISREAKACPHCGHPVKSRGVQTVEQTGKEMKLSLIGAGILICIGGVTTCAQLSTGLWAHGDGDASATLGIVLLFAGILWWGITRFMTWWRYK